MSFTAGGTNIKVKNKEKKNKHKNKKNVLVDFFFNSARTIIIITNF